MTSKIKVDNINKVSDDSNIINKCGTAINVGASGNTVTVTGNDIRSDNYKAADGGVIVSQSGTTITLGASGDTVSLASGASQTGFGRTGTVDWQTSSIKTGTFTAVSGEGYFVNTTSGAVTGNLPASPSAGDIVAFADYAGTAGSNQITIGRNGSNIEGVALDGAINQNRDSITLVYVDGTQGWLAVNDNESSFIAPGYVTATGGTITTVCTNFKVHTFTGPGTFTVTCAGNAAGSNSVDYMVLAGGGGGGGSQTPGGGGGGGGAGGWRASNGTASGTYSAAPGPLAPSLTAPVSAITVTAQGYPITVGAAGPGSPSGCAGSAGGAGSNSSALSITSAGGGGGGRNSSPQQGGGPGGSGGGTSWQARSEPNRGLGNTPPVSPPQGNNGGLASGNPNYSGGGGGGAAAVGACATTSPCAAGNGGSSLCSSIDGSPKSYAGGGGGGSSGSHAGGSGGGAGAGTGGRPGSTTGSNASDANRGSGGGSGGGGGTSGGGNGASGVVVIRYKFQ